MTARESRGLEVLAERAMKNNMAAAVEVIVEKRDSKVPAEEALGGKPSAENVTEIEIAADGRMLKVSAEELDNGRTAAAEKAV